VEIKMEAIMTDERNDKGFRKLIVWQRAHQLALSIYKLTEKFPKTEIYGLTSQLRRASVSGPANIAEGYGYGRKGQTGRFLDIAQGSLSEVEYYLILALDLKYFDQGDYEKCEALRAETGFLLYRLQQSIKKP
jgi:four helix bundle protein